MEIWILGIVILGLYVGLRWYANRQDPGGVNREKSRLSIVTQQLRKEPNGWAAPVLVKRYETKSGGEKLFQEEATILVEHGYQPTTQTGEGSHIHAGRLLLTGGLSVLAGQKGIRSKGALTVTYQKAQEAAAGAERGPCPRCGESIVLSALQCRYCSLDLVAHDADQQPT